MRTLITSALLVLALAAPALAQSGYIYQPSGLEYMPTEPVAAGDSVQGLVALSNGLTGFGQVYVEGVYYDDLFAYWQGTYNGEAYYYDRFSGYWRPGPVTYRHATLAFQGAQVEGFIRVFGNYQDKDQFFSTDDGVLYKRITIKRGRSRDTSRRSQVKYTYFINTLTLERSDIVGPGYTVVGDEQVAKKITDELDAATEQQLKDKEAQIAAAAAEDPAFPMWQDAAQTPPAEVVAPDAVPSTAEPTVRDLIEQQVGPLDVDASKSGQADPGELSQEANKPKE